MKMFSSKNNNILLNIHMMNKHFSNYIPKLNKRIEAKMSNVKSMGCGRKGNT